MLIWVYDSQVNQCWAYPSGVSNWRQVDDALNWNCSQSSNYSNFHFLRIGWVIYYAPDSWLSTGNIRCLTQQAQPWEIGTAAIPRLPMRTHKELGMGIPTLPKRRHSEVLSLLSKDREKMLETGLKPCPPGCRALVLHHLLPPPFPYPTHEHDDTEQSTPETSGQHPRQWSAEAQKFRSSHVRCNLGLDSSQGRETEAGNYLVTGGQWSKGQRPEGHIIHTDFCVGHFKVAA